MPASRSSRAIERAVQYLEQIEIRADHSFSNTDPPPAIDAAMTRYGLPMA
jgi:hypothetical protein